MNDDLNADLPAGNEALLRRLFSDAGATQPAVPDDRFVQQVMQGVHTVQRRQLLFSVLPVVMSFVGAMLLLNWMLTPVFSQIPAFLAALWSGTGATPVSASGSGMLIPLLVLLLALVLPALVDRLPGFLKL